jgi:hypothetical protein
VQSKPARYTCQARVQHLEASNPDAITLTPAWLICKWKNDVTIAQGLGLQPTVDFVCDYKEKALSKDLSDQSAKGFHLPLVAA